MLSLLKDVLILDLTHMLAGPYGSLLLADLGAKVIKIEPPKTGDRTRLIGPPFIEGQSAYFISVNRNKKSITLNLKKTKAKEIFFDLVKKADVVYDNFKPGVLKKLGIHYEELIKHNPRIIGCSSTAFGDSKAYGDMPAFDLVIQAMGGSMSFTGEPSGPPVRMGLPMGDLGGGMFGALAIASALYNREKTGKGSRIDITLLDCQLSMLTYVAQYYLSGGIVPGPIGSGHQSVVPYQAFQTKDQYIVVAIFVEKYWENFCKVLELEELLKDDRFSSNLKRSENRTFLIPRLEKRLLEKPAEEWLKKLFEAGVPSAPILTVDKILTSPYVEEREMIIETDHPQYGPVKSVGNPVKVPDQETERDTPAPLLGENTEEILKEYLGMDGAEMRKLRDEGVF